MSNKRLYYKGGNEPMGKMLKTFLLVGTGMISLTSCYPKTHQIAPGSELREENETEEGILEGIDDKEDIQGEDAKFFTFYQS